MLKTIHLIIIITFIGLYSCSTKHAKVDADLLLINGNIYSLAHAKNPNAIALKDGLIIAIGNSDSLTSKFKATETIDLNGKAVYPGFIDAHCHFLGYGRNLFQVNLEGTQSYDELIKRVIDFTDKNPTKYLQGRGWDQTDWADKTLPNNQQLNNLYPDIPVLLKRIDGHAALANQKALDLANINAKSKIDGGQIMLDSTGNLTGILIDNAVDLVSSVFPDYSEEQNRKAIIKAQENCFKVGLTSLVDAGLPLKDLLFLEQLDKDSTLKMPLDVMMSAEADAIAHYNKTGAYKGNNLQIQSIKCYMDGALGSRGALLLAPYSDDSSQIGLQLVSDSAIHFYAKAAKDMGFQFNTHAIGDGAVRKICEIYSKYLEPGNDKRWRIEHSQVVNPADLATYAKYVIIPSVQSTHATSDMYWAEERLGKERVKHAYSYKNLLSCNGWLVNGSDFPVEQINPLFGFYAAVSRKDQNGFPNEGFYKDQGLSRLEALKTMTIWAAKGSFLEHAIGTLEIGKQANIVVLDTDIMTCSEDEIYKSQVLSTYIKGKLMYSNANN